MNEVALAGPIIRRIISSEDRERRAVSGRGIDGERDQMRLRIVTLGQIAVRVRTGGVEVAQHGDAQTFGRERIRENLLASELRAPVWVDWALRRAFCNR